MKNKFNKFLKATKKWGSKHTPDILVACGIASTVTSTVLAVKATPKALMLIEEAKLEKRKNDEDTDQLSKVEVIKAAWKPYIPAVLSGIAGVACILTAHSVNLKRNAVVATAYKLTETAFNEYKDAVVEEIGEKKERIVKEKVVEKKMQKHPVDNKEVIITDNGKTLFFDSISSRYFESDMNTIRKTVLDLNYKIMNEEYLSLNEFYYELGLEPTAVGDQLGWNSAYGGLEINYTSKIAANDRPCIVLDYEIAPRYDYSKLM